MSAAIVHKGAVISIGSDIDTNISVVHSDGTVNRDCISVARLPYGEKIYHYILQDGDIIAYDTANGNPSMRRLSFKVIELQQNGHRFTSIARDYSQDNDLTKAARQALEHSDSRRTLNAEAIHELIQLNSFSALLTHGITPNAYGHQTDFLMDAIGILFEKLDVGESVKPRGNAIQSILMVDNVNNKLVTDPFIDLASTFATTYSGSPGTLLMTRSLKHAMRITISTHSTDNLEFAKEWFKKLITGAGFSIRKTTTKRGELFMVLPKISQKAAKLCEILK